MANDAYDIAVIGAGIAGVATALHLMMQKRKVILIDRRGAGLETSYGNAGVVGSGYVLPFGFPSIDKWPGILLDRDASARLRYADLPRTLPWLIDFFLQSLPKQRRRNGEKLRPLIARAIDEHRVLMYGTDAEQYMNLARQVALYRTEQAFMASITERKIAQEMGVPFEVLDMQAFRAMEPHIKPAFHKAIHWTGGAHLSNPGAVVMAYAERFVREGGKFLQSAVQGLTAVEGGWQITTAQGHVAARQVVMCAGPWSNDLLKPLGYRFPMIVKRGYHQHYTMNGGAAIAHAMTDVEYGYVISRMEEGIRITTGAEFAVRDAPPNPVQLARILPRARELFPLGKAIDPRPWLGSRPCFADSLPVVGPAPKHGGLWLNFGHGHMGMTIGPSTGKLIAEMMAGLPTFCDPHPYRASRFG